MYTHVRGIFIAASGFAASVLAHVFGGLDMLLRTLLVFMAIDIISGFVVAAVFKCSDKTGTGRLSSQAGLQGLVRKGGCLTLVAIAVHLDALLGTNSLTRDAVIIAFSLNELLSILENMGRMGIKMPAPIINAIEALSKKQSN
ncbi:MAG: phage holin family protein [Defluviitaleaceae bacterium]|nr:phage holin family protein [Defluviitaleaceae bacterium]MCL2217784.1 phage holin family protein [Defluviitaleaceae bacterium]